MPRRSASPDCGRYAGIAVSAIWHLALLWALAAYVTRPFRPRLEGIDVSVVPASVFIPWFSRPKPVAADRPLSPRRPTIPARGPAPNPAPGPIATSVGAPAQAAPLTSDQPPSQQDAGVDGRVRNVLRGALGCTDTAPLGLSESEKKACAAKAQARAKEAAPMPLARMEPSVQSYYGAVDRAYHEGNLPGAACAIGQGEISCKVIPPHGVLTEELGLAPP